MFKFFFNAKVIIVQGMSYYKLFTCKVKVRA